MNRRFQWLIGILALVFAAFVGAYTYNLGVAHGLAHAAVAAAPGGAPPPFAYWARPWGFGFFPFFPIFPFFFMILFWVVLFRAIAGRGRWHRGACGYSRGGHRQWETPPPPQQA
jgi:hypothetical protein